MNEAVARDPAGTGPAELSGLARRFPATAAVIGHAFHRGEVRGVQLHVWRDGEVLVDLGTGDAGAGVRMTPDTLLLWICAGKPVAAVALMQLVERGLVRLEDRVSGHIPEYGAGGKERVRVVEVLAQTVPYVSKDPAAGYEAYGNAVGLKWTYEAPIDSERAGAAEPRYTGIANWLILAELVRRLDGRDFGSYVRAEIFEPLDMTDCWFGVPPRLLPGYDGRIGVLQARGANGTWRRVTDPPDEARYWSQCWPGNGGRGPFRQLANVYKMCLDGGVVNGRRLLSGAAIAQMTRTQVRSALKPKVQFGWGFLTAPRSYGRYPAAGSFGFGGGQASKVFADPVRRLVVALSLNRLIRGEKLRTAIFDGIYEDLGIAA